MYSSILVGTDGSETATKAVERAAALAAFDGATLTVFSAGPDGASVAAAEVERLGDRGMPIVARSTDASPANAIVEEAEQGDYDLVVLGNKGLAGIRRLLPIGKVPNRVSHHLRRSLLIVKTT